jgi:hypothetical protein
MPKTQTTEDAASFEEALERLENIVESLESGDIPLADLVTKNRRSKNSGRKTARPPLSLSRGPRRTPEPLSFSYPGLRL